MHAANNIFKGVKGAFSSAGSSAKSIAWRGTEGTIGLVGAGSSLFVSYKMYANEYGAGGALAIGAGETTLFLLPPIVSIPVAIAYHGGKAVYDYGKSTYRENRKLNMGRPVNDYFGTMATMRQRSASTLQRGRAILGSEARMMHY